jgi:uncharacterized protein (DUF1778 family)
LCAGPRNSGPLDRRFRGRRRAETARETVAEVEVIRLSREEQEQFASMLLNPPPSDALLRALERHRTLIVE